MMWHGKDGSTMREFVDFVIEENQKLLTTQRISVEKGCGGFVFEQEKQEILAVCTNDEHDFLAPDDDGKLSSITEKNDELKNTVMMMGTHLIHVKNVHHIQKVGVSMVCTGVASTLLQAQRYIWRVRTDLKPLLKKSK